MKPDNAMVGRHVIILLANIPAIECKVSSLFEDEIIANYVDGDEVHISMAHVAAWWYDKKSHAPKKKKVEQWRKEISSIARQSLASSVSGGRGGMEA